MENESESLEKHFINVKRSRAWLFSIAVLTLFGIVYYSYNFFISEYFWYSLINRLVIITDVFMVFTLSIYWYLQVKPIFPDYRYTFKPQRDINDIQKRLNAVKEIETAISLHNSTEENTKDIVSYINNRIDLLPYENDISIFSEETLTNNTKLELFKTTLRTINNELIEQSILEEKSELKKEEKTSEREKASDRALKLFNFVTSRLKEEVEKLSKRANIYIAFGSAITLVAGIVLYFTVQELLSLSSTHQEEIKSSISQSEILSLIVRFSIVVFIEVFAFYYLKLYRNLMDTIKYYQNEITNIEMKMISLYAIESNGCADSLKIFVSELAKTERNFVIDKGKTTIDIEKTKLEKNIINQSTENVIKLINSIK